MTPEQAAQRIHIPAAALEAGKNAVALDLYGYPWVTLPMEYRNQCERIARAAIAAALSAWPGMYIGRGFVLNKNIHDLILPLPENPDAE